MIVRRIFERQNEITFTVFVVNIISFGDFSALPPQTYYRFCRNKSMLLLSKGVLGCY